ncbi:hypothetical protein [Streptomyces sp. NPDC059957]|uniref:hypothetical protein n=1 Tax=unclassified Streptomyces TaxID=2593676 RepID=UPI00364EFFA2
MLIISQAGTAGAAAHQAGLHFGALQFDGPGADLPWTNSNLDAEYVDLHNDTGQALQRAQALTFREVNRTRGWACPPPRRRRVLLEGERGPAVPRQRCRADCAEPESVTGSVQGHLRSPRTPSGERRTAAMLLLHPENTGAKHRKQNTAHRT